MLIVEFSVEQGLAGRPSSFAIRRQLAQINAAMPGTVSPDAFAPAAQSSVTVKASSERGDYALWIIGGTLAAGAALVLFGGSRR